VPHINARAETIEKLPLFREAFAKRRCVIPATGFYEWQKREDPDLMEAYAVSRVINSVKNDTEECIEPVED
jgi:putative SOS response-associated peptidase YedK